MHQLNSFGVYEIGLKEGLKIEDGISNTFFMNSMTKSPEVLKDMTKLIEIVP
jgi:hypothetical protein